MISMMLFALRWLCRVGVSAVVACALLLCASPLRAQAQTPETLTPHDIDAAIKWGMDGDPTPFLLHHKGLRGKPSTAVVGAVYTPFLRVALAAKAARAAGRDFTSRDVTPNLIEPVVYVAFRWYCCVDPQHGDDMESWDPSRPPVDYKIAAPEARGPVGNPSTLRLASPLWTSRDTSLLAAFGGAPPYRDVVLVAAYPMSVLTGGANFVIYREWGSSNLPEGGSAAMLVGEVTPEDLTHWR